MDINEETVVIAKDDYNKLLDRLKESEKENVKLARALKASNNRNSIYKLNVETQSLLNTVITRAKEMQEMYVKLLLESCPDIIFMIDEKMKFLLGTNSTSAIIGIDDISIIYGREFDSIVERYEPSAITQEMIMAIKDIINRHNNNKVRGKMEVDTGNKKYSVNMLSFHKENGEFAGVLVIMHDITELIEAKDLAEQASRAKSEFLSRMSHEMRTPMNAIIGMTKIAKDSKDLNKKEYCLDKIESSSNHLLCVINDILDMSKIEADKFELSFNEFDFEKMLFNVLNSLNFRIEEKNQNLIIDICKDVPLYIVSDELRLTQVISNLLTNAVKFTPDGGTITLVVKNLYEIEDEITLQIEVIDNGIGVSDEQQRRLFQFFEQADGGIARKFGGTGLGLAISKKIVEMMGGRIWIESELYKGAAFKFIVKVKKGGNTDERSLTFDKKEIHVLAVDDSPEIREYFAYVMGAFGLSCDVAASGSEALAMIGRKQYNMFFVDWRMPEMDGIELAKKIKSLTEDNPVIIMISASAWSDIENEAIEAGVDRFIPKPLFPSALINTINECVTISQPIKTAVPKNQEQSAQSYKDHVFLIAEDVDINREIIAAILEPLEAEIDFAKNGLEAVKLFEERAERYSLILMDIHMPEMDGYSAAREIRSIDRRNAQSIPILAMTADVFREDIEKCIKSGMDDHVGKPVDMDDLFAKIEKYVKVN